jgi:predicted ATPase/class 3 adenylate cyclase
MSGEARQLPTGTVTFLFTDIESSTETAASMGDAAYADALQRHRDLLRAAFEALDGHEVGTEGDSFFVAFARAHDALDAATEGQRVLASQNLRVRMGLHTGEALVRNQEYVGHDIHKAKRISDAGHGGQILLSEETATLVRAHLPDSVSVVDLGPHRLKDLEEAQRIFQVVHADLTKDFPPLRTLDTFANNLPAQRTTFVGRSREIADIRKLLETNRLVTLIGVGGSGKTRLAIQVGAELLDEYRDGVYFVDLAPISDSSAIVPAIASAVRLPIGTDVTIGAAQGSPENFLIDFLAPRTSLLILDNCEHMLDGCAAIADHILERCLSITLLATSREGLAVQGEQVWQIPSLSLPDADGDVESSEAVSLFKVRAQATRANFELTPQNIAVVSEICRRLDGIPLAIEFAAARVSHLTPQEIASRLQDMFRLLTGGRGRVQRQQTMQAALDWSYHLLSDEERTLLRRLPIFPGIFQSAWAAEICSDHGLRSEDIPDLLGSLVSKSLVTMEEVGGTAGYRLFETVRLYAAEKLNEAGEADLYRERNRDWWEKYASSLTWEETFFAPRLEDVEPEWFNQRNLTEMQAGLRAALEWSAASGRLDRVIGLAARTFPFWGILGPFDEGYRWLTRARPEDLDLTPEVRAAALSAASLLASTMNDPATVDLGERAVAAAGDTPSVPLVYALTRRGVNRAIWSLMSMDSELATGARDDTARARRAAETLSVRAQSFVLSQSVAIELILGDLRAAEAASAATVSLNPDSDDALASLAACAHIACEHDRALEAANRYFDVAARRLFAWLPAGGAGAAIAAIGGAGDLERARELLADRLDVARRFRSRLRAIEHLMVGGAALAYIAGDHARCSRLLAWVRSRTFDAGQIIFSAPAFALYRHYTALVRESIDRDDARRYRQEGRTMSEDEAIACALEVS